MFWKHHQGEEENLTKSWIHTLPRRQKESDKISFAKLPLKQVGIKHQQGDEKNLTKLSLQS